MTPEREALRRAIEAHRQSLEHVAQCKDMLQRANNIDCALSAELAEHEGLDDEIAQARAAQMKLALATGEHHFDIAEPEGFSSRIIARNTVQERLATVHVALPTLERELANAEKAAADLDIERERAAARVFVKEAERIAEDFNLKIGTLKRQSYIINAMAFKQTRGSANVRSIGGVHPVYSPLQMPLAVREAVAEDVLGLHEQKFGFAMRDGSRFAVNAFWAALQRDADAIFGEEPQDDAQKHAAE